LAQAGVKDMVRISDARMSGTAYGTVVLHVAPEAADGGPLAAVRDGDRITIDVAAGTLDVDLSEAELAARLVDWTAPASAYDSGVFARYRAQVRSASEGAVLRP
jgi:dihydroxyacid dehydratase/phosphogluconate dehydratase